MKASFLRFDEKLIVPYVLSLTVLILVKIFDSSEVGFLLFLSIFVIHLIRRYDPRIPLAIGILLLFVMALNYYFYNEENVTQIVKYSYYFIVLGFVLCIYEYIIKKTPLFKRIQHGSHL